LSIGDNYKNLDNCFSSFVKSEKLGKDYNWRCDECNGNQESEKKLLLWKSPKILIIQLKRFDFMSNKKIQDNIGYPLNNFDLNRYIDGYDKSESKYNLSGIIEHIGSLDRGHYISHNLNSNNNWYTYDDDQVYECSLSDIKNKQAYILCYIKNN
jgi:ubiquitin C-terminal hydrolase